MRVGFGVGLALTCVVIGIVVAVGVALATVVGTALVDAGVTVAIGVGVSVGSALVDVGLSVGETWTVKVWVGRGVSVDFGVASTYICVGV